MLDQACAVLVEAGYPDPWMMTPRQIMHRLHIHRHLKDYEGLRELDIATLASRGDDKTIESFRSAITERHAPERSHSEETSAPVPVSDATAKRLDALHGNLPWRDRK